MNNDVYPQKPKKTRWTTFIRLGIATFLLIFLLRSVGLNNLFTAIKNIHLLPLLGVTICGFSLIVIGALNMWLLLNALTPISFTILLRAYSYSWAMSLITPGQAGDATIILLMKKHRIPYSLTGSAYFIDKIITLSIFVTISAYGCYYLLPNNNINYIKLLKNISIAILIVSITAKVISLRFRSLSRTPDFLINLLNGLLIIKSNFHIAIFNFVLTIVKWIVVSLSFRLAFLSFRTTIEWPDIGVIPIMSTLVGYIPISIGGVGTVELSATYLFGLKSVPANIVLSTYIFMRLINYLSGLSIISLIDPFKAD